MPSFVRPYHKMFLACSYVGAISQYIPTRSTIRHAVK